MIKKLCAALAALLSTAALAGGGYGDGYGYGSSEYEDRGFYIGGSVGEIFYKEQGLDTIVPSVAFLNMGVKVNPYLAVEGRVGGGIEDDESRGYRVDVPLVYGGYLKGILPVTRGSPPMRSPASAACSCIATTRISMPMMSPFPSVSAPSACSTAAPGSTPNGPESITVTTKATTTRRTSCRSA